MAMNSASTGTHLTYLESSWHGNSVAAVYTLRAQGSYHDEQHPLASDTKEPSL
jgi:hypothetical protein